MLTNYYAGSSGRDGESNPGLGCKKVVDLNHSAIHKLLCEPHTHISTYSSVLLYCSSTSSIVDVSVTANSLAGEVGS